MTKEQLHERIGELLGLATQLKSQTTLNPTQSYILSRLCMTSVQCCYNIKEAMTAEGVQRRLKLSYFFWAVRTLYETKVWIKYCVSVENAERFAMASVRDLDDLVNALNRELSRSPDAVVPEDQVKNARDGIELLRRLVSKKELNVELMDAVEYLKLEHEHQTVYKALSKLTHITALSILLWNVKTEDLQPIMEPLLTYSETFTAEIIAEMTTLVAKG